MIEVEAGYKGFYKVGNEKCTVTVGEYGIKLVFNCRAVIPNGTDVVKQLFKPMLNIYKAKKYAERMPAISSDQALLYGFYMVTECSIS